MQTFIHNLKQQSALSLATTAVTTTLVLFLLSNIFNAILGAPNGLWLGFNAFFLSVFPLFIASVVKTLGIALLITKKSLKHGAFIGAIIFGIVTLSDVITSLIDKSLPSLLIGVFVIIYGAAQYVLPGLMLGFFRKD